MDNIIFQSPINQHAVQPSVIKTVNTGDTVIRYIGYARPGTKLTSEERFAICREENDLLNNVITYMFAGGTLERKFAFDDCETLEYRFLK